MREENLERFTNLRSIAFYLIVCRLKKLRFEAM